MLPARFARTRLVHQLVVVVTAVAAVALLASPPAEGKPQDDKRRVDAQLAQTEAVLESATVRARQAGVAFAQASRQLPAAELAVAEARGRVAAAEAQATEARRVAAAAQRDLDAAEAAFTRAQRAVDAARDRLSGFVRETYQGAPFLAMSAVLAEGDLDEVLGRLAYVDAFIGGFQRSLDAVVRTRFTVAERRAQVAERQQAAESAARRAEQTLGAARTAQDSAESAQRQVAQLVAQRQGALATAQQERTISAEQYQELLAESRRIAGDLRAAAHRARGNRPPRTRPPRVGRLLLPVNGWTSSDFGLRYDPFYRRWQRHAGTDFAAPGGSPIRAAAAGVVVHAGRNGGYGNYTCVYHFDVAGGRGLSTCYAHQSRILVWTGQRVRRGQLIGRVGTTGASTGNHLHFEVRLDGEPVNPMRWL